MKYSRIYLVSSLGIINNKCSIIFFFQIAFELMSVIAVITNCALIAMSPQVQEYIPTYGAITVIVVVVIAEVSNKI